MKTRKAHKLWDWGRRCTRKFFLPPNFNTNPLNILVHLQLLWLHNRYQFKVLSICYRLAVIFNGIILRSPILRVNEVLWGWDLHQSKARPIPLNTKFCSICHRLAGIPLSKFPSKFDPRLGLRLRWTYGVKNDTNQNVVSTFLFDFNTHYRPILHRLATIHNAAGIYRPQTGNRQSDRNRPSML